MIKNCLRSGLILLLIFPYGTEKAEARTFRLNCDSINGRTSYCAVEAGRNATVRLVRQRSNTPCEGNWEFRRGSIEVRNGCRGEFEVSFNGQGAGGDRFRTFHGIPGAGRVVVDRDSYRDRRRVREFDAIVNNRRENWWVNCRNGEVGSEDRSLGRNPRVNELSSFVCNDFF